MRVLVALGRRCRREQVAVDGRLGLLAGAGDEVRADKVGGGKGDLVEWPGLADGLVALDLWPGEAGGRVAWVDGRDQPRFAEVVFGFEVLDFGAVGAVDDADGDGEDGVALRRRDQWVSVRAREWKAANLCVLSDGIVDDLVVGGYFLFGRVRQVAHARLFLPQVDVT